VNRHRKGFSVLELLVSATVFSLVTALLVLLFSQSLEVWRRTSGRDTAARELRKARAALERDLALASPAQLRRSSNLDGEALWFLSPIDPATRQIARGSDGLAIWQRNILYYLVIPANHDALFGVQCTPAAGPNGMDDRCTHKVLVRKVIDSDTLLPDVSAYLTQPNGFDLSGMSGEPNLDEAAIVANRLLTFQTESAPPPHGVPNLVRVDLRAVDEEEARHETTVGTQSMYIGKYTLQGPFTVLLEN
jgi:hypothetical protein